MNDTDSSTDAAVTAKTYRLALSGDGIEVLRDVSEGIAREIIGLLLGGSLVDGQENRGFSPTVGSPTRPAPGRSLREYMDEVEAKRNPDKILAIGTYLVDHGGRDGLSGDDIRAQFKSAGEPVPSNFSRDIRWTVTNGWIAEDPSSGQNYVTQKGREALRQKFSESVRQSTKQQTRRQRRRSRKDPESAEVQ